jgi:hypothetical protein
MMEKEPAKGLWRAKEAAVEMHRLGLQDTDEPQLLPLPAPKSSRMHMYLELPVNIFRNRRYYLAYMDT